MTATGNEGWRLWPVPIVMGIVPVFTVLLSAIIAMRTGAVPSCIPFIEGCTSISATGRYMPANYLFRGLMLPYSALFALYWVLVALWLRSMEPTRVAHAAWIRWAGVAAGATLIVYIVTLGTEGKAYELMRQRCWGSDHVEACKRLIFPRKIQRAVYHGCLRASILA